LLEGEKGWGEIKGELGPQEKPAKREGGKRKKNNTKE